jgi:TP901 family phage tail tape measure protein
MAGSNTNMKKMLDLLVNVSAKGMTQAASSLKELADAIKNLRKENGLLMQSFTNLSKRLDRVRESAIGASRALGASGYSKTAKNATKSTNELNQEVSKTTSTLNKSKQSTDNSSKGVMSFSGRIGTAVRWLGAYAIAGQVLQQIIKLLAFVFIDSIKAFITYENELKKLQAITGASTQEVNQLSEAAINLAKSTVFTSTEIIELQKQLAKLGFSVSEIKDAQAGIAAFAQATGLSIGQSAELVGKAIRAFNLSAASSQRIVNTFITGINKSALSGEYLATSMQYVASIGDQLNASVEMVTASLGILANAGFTASRAGTGLRLIFTEIGSAGEDLTETLRRLKKENISLSEAKELVGQRGAGALLTLINKYEEVNELVQMSSDLTAKFSAEMTTLSSQANAWKQLGVVIGEANKSFGELIYSALEFDEAVLTFVNNFERLGTLGGIIATLIPFAEMNFWLSVSDKQVGMASSRLRFSDLISKASKEEVKTLLEASDLEAKSALHLNEREIALNNIISNQKESGKITAKEYEFLMMNKDIRNNILQIVDEEAKIIERTTGIEKARSFLVAEMSYDMEEMVKNAKEYSDIVNGFDSAFRSSQEELNMINDRIELNKATIDFYKNFGGLRQEEIDRLEKENIALEGRAEGLDEMIKKYTEINALQLYEESKLFSKAQYTKEIAERENEIKKIQSRGLRDSSDKKRIKTLTDELKLLKEMKTLYYGDENGSGSNERENEREADKIAEIAELSRYASMSTEELVNHFIKLNEQLNRAKDIGDSYGMAEASIQIEELVNYILPQASDSLRAWGDLMGGVFKDGAGRAAEFVSVYEAMASEERKARDMEILEQYFSEAFNDYESQLSNFIKDTEKTSEKFNELGGFSKWVIARFTRGTEEDIDAYSKAKDRVLQQAKKTAIEAVNSINQSIQANLDSEIRAIDARYSYEEKRYRAMVDANIITQEQYEKKLEKLEKERVEKTNKIQKKKFNAEKLNSIAIATIEGAIAMIRAKTWPERILIGALSAIQIGIIAAQQFTPTEFEKGGVVEGRSHAEGGVPFTVRGRGGYEMEGGEFIVNKKATAKHLPLLEQINSGVSSVSSRPLVSKKREYAEGGMVGGDMTMLLAEIRNELKRPVRAYVSERELMGKMNERIDIKKRSAR